MKTPSKNGHGGKREGAGRKPTPLPYAMNLLPANVTPLDWLLAVMRDAAADPALRLKCAIAALPFTHGRMPVGRKAEAAASSARATANRYATNPPPRLVPFRKPDDLN